MTQPNQQDNCPCEKCHPKNGLFMNCLKDNQQDIEKWEEEFDKEFPNSRGIFENNDPYDSRRKAIKQFIYQTLHSQKEKWVKEKIEKIEKLLEWETVEENTDGEISSKTQLLLNNQFNKGIKKAIQIIS